ncbi:MAG: sulfite exporter TauE/SafE family protein [Burkholderiales bacterium]|nr:sulfite exporter TauE/SafE family protein [Burkholderiales bacterium]
MNWALDVPVFVCIGAVAGFASGLLGIGGGILIVPAMVLIGSLGHADPGQALIRAVATSSLVVCVNSLMSMGGHWRRGAIAWCWVRRCAPGCAAGAICGAALATSIDRLWVVGGVVGMELFAAFALLSSTLPGRQVLTTDLPRPPGRWFAGAAGTMIGVASASAGIAGGTLLTPYLTLSGLGPGRAAGTSAALGLAIGGSAALAFIAMPALHFASRSGGYVDYGAALCMIAGGLVAAQMGVAAAHAWPRDLLKRILAATLLVSAASFALHALFGR